LYADKFKPVIGLLEFVEVLTAALFIISVAAVTAPSVIVFEA